MIIDAWYELSVALADPIVPLSDVLHEWRHLDDGLGESSSPRPDEVHAVDAAAE
jgi:hypothetical protein